MDDIASTADFDILVTPALAANVRSSVEAALSCGAVFPCEPRPTAVFQRYLRNSIKDIETERGQLLQNLLVRGPYGQAR